MAKPARRSPAPASRVVSGAPAAAIPCPERLLLQWVQDDAAVEAALVPGVADKALPVLNVGSGPSGEPLGAPGAMECRRNGPSGALAGRDHESAAVQPRIDLG